MSKHRRNRPRWNSSVYKELPHELRSNVPNGSVIISRPIKHKKYKIGISNFEYNRKIRNGTLKVWKTNE